MVRLSQLLWSHYYYFHIQKLCHVNNADTNSHIICSRSLADNKLIVSSHSVASERRETYIFVTIIRNGINESLMDPLSLSIRDTVDVQSRARGKNVA